MNLITVDFLQTPKKESKSRWHGAEQAMEM